MVLVRAVRKLFAELHEGRGRRLLARARAALTSEGQPPHGVAGDRGEAVDVVMPDPSCPCLITISLRSKKLRLYRDGRHVRTYRVAVASAPQVTRAGLYAIQNKFVDPEWKVPNAAWAGELAGTIVPPGAPENEMKARWMGVYPGVGIHGTDRVGLFGLRLEASRGCIRMPVPDVIDLYERVPVRTPVFIG